MNKFKVGDSVRALKNCRSGDFTKNGIYTVKDVRSDRIIVYNDNNGEENGWTSICFELVENAQSELEKLIEEANKGEQAIKDLVTHKYFHTKVDFEDIGETIPGYVYVRYSLKKKEFMSFTVKEGWRVSVQGNYLHIGRKIFLIAEIRSALTELINDNVCEYSSDSYNITTRRSGLRFIFAPNEQYILFYESAEQILKALESID